MACFQCAYYKRQGGAGVFYGGQRVWPGFANAIQQVNKTGGPPGDDQYRILGIEEYLMPKNQLVKLN